jgi:O-methyltransferase
MGWSIVGLKSGKELYLELLKKTLLNEIWLDKEIYMPLQSSDKLPLEISSYLKNNRLEAVKRVMSDRNQRKEGLDWPCMAHTMIGRYRLENLQKCMETVLKEKIEGDFIETGVWRGGACIFMRGLLKVNGIIDRRVWVADSFEGLPEPDLISYPKDKNDKHHTLDFLKVSFEEVKLNFQKYDLLDSQVCFLKGWFKDTLPKAPIDQLAILRLDGDMYGSTMDSLTSLYSKVAKGGFIIVDDYGSQIAKPLFGILEGNKISLNPL